MLCRGIFTPQNDVVETKWEHHVFAAVFQPESGGYPLAGAFVKVGLIKCALPFAALCLLSPCFSRRSLLLSGWPLPLFPRAQHADPRLTFSCPGSLSNIVLPTSMGGSVLRSKKGAQSTPERCGLPGRRFPSWSRSQGDWESPCCPVALRTGTRKETVTAPTIVCLIIKLVCM